MLKMHPVRSMLAAMVGFAGFVAFTGSAAAAGPIFHDRFNETIPDVNLCGVDFTLHVSGSVVGWETESSFMTAGQVTQVFITDDGRSVTIQAAGPFVSTFTENGDTVTFVDTYIGMPEKIASRGARGTVLLDAGVISFITTFNVVTGEVTTDVAVHGPHPEADSDFTLFCTAVLEALGS